MTQRTLREGLGSEEYERFQREANWTEIQEQIDDGSNFEESTQPLSTSEEREQQRHQRRRRAQKPSGADSDSELEGFRNTNLIEWGDDHEGTNITMPNTKTQ